MENVSTKARLVAKKPHLLQFYSAQTPNGLKVAACLEELVALKEQSGAPFNYEPHSVDIRHDEQHKSEFLKINPCGKIPAICDPHGPNGQKVTIFESGAILLYLADKYAELLPPDEGHKIEVKEWLFFGSVNISTQFKAFGFYYKYCPHSIPYCVERYAKECHRLLGILEHQLTGKEHMIGAMYTIADLAIWPWLNGLYENYGDALTVVFKDLQDYPNVKAWYQRCLNRPASKKALDVCPFLTETA